MFCFYYSSDMNRVAIMPIIHSTILPKCLGQRAFVLQQWGE